MQAAAALNNAEWCDIVCRSHGLAAASAGDVLAQIDATVGCSVKDSFASLDLSALGFRVLFDAEWIVRAGDTPAPAPAGPRWEQVRGLDDVAQWKRAWSGEGGPTAVLRDELLDHHAVSVLAARDGERVPTRADCVHRRTVPGLDVGRLRIRRRARRCPRVGFRGRRPAPRLDTRRRARCLGGTKSFPGEFRGEDVEHAGPAPSQG